MCTAPWLWVPKPTQIPNSPEFILKAPVPTVIIKCHQVKLGGNWHKEINERKAKCYINKSTVTSKIISSHSEIPMYRSVFKCVPP